MRSRLFRLFTTLCLNAYALLFGWRILRPLHLFLLHLACRGLGINAYGSFRVTGETHALEKFGKEIDIVMDVGANEGKYAAEVLRIIGPSQVYCFEPHPQTALRLGQRFHNDSRVKIINKALSDRPSTTILYDYADASGTAFATLVPGVINQIHARETTKIEVETTTIDDVVESEDVEKIDLLKIDVEGHELAVLTGATSTLDNLRPRFIQFEFNEMNTLTGTPISAFVNLLHNYDLFRLLPKDMIKIDRPFSLECRIFAFQTIWAIRRDSGS